MSALNDLEELVDAAVTAAEMEAGVPPAIVASRSRLDLEEVEKSLEVEVDRQERAKPNLGRWTPEEEAFVRNNLGVMSLEELGVAIGRTATAIKVRFTRKGWAAPSKQPGELVAREVAWRLGKCGKSIKALIERGILPGRRIPGKRGIHVVAETAFYRWAINPENWIYFNHERVRDAKLKRLLEIKRQRWGDEWLTTGQVARMHRLPGGSNDVTRHIYAGKLPAVKYQFWRVRRSVAENYGFTRGRGSGSALEWPAEADAFLVLCSAIGAPRKAIAALMKWPRWRPGYRLRLLSGEGRIKEFNERFGLGVMLDHSPEGRAILFADWRDHSHRFPSLALAVKKLRDERHMSARDRRWLRGVLLAWARWHGRCDPGRQLLVGRLSAGGWNSEARIRRAWGELQGWGADPFESK